MLPASVQSYCTLVTHRQMELMERNPFHLCVHTHRKFLRPTQHGGDHVSEVQEMTRHLLPVLRVTCSCHSANFRTRQNYM